MKKSYLFFFISIANLIFNQNLRAMDWESASPANIKREALSLAHMVANCQPTFNFKSESTQEKIIEHETQTILQLFQSKGVNETRNFIISRISQFQTNITTEKTSTKNSLDTTKKYVSLLNDQTEDEFLTSEWKRFCLPKLKQNEAKIESSIEANKSQVDSIINNIKLGVPRAIIFNGRTGTGKTTLAQAIPTKEKIDFIVIDSASIIGRYRGSSTANIANIFKHAQEQDGRFIIIFEEIDKLLIPAKDQDQTAPGTMQTQINACLSNYPNITIFATSNYAHNLSPELRRRFSIIDVPFPAKDDIQIMIMDTLKHFFTTDTFAKTLTSEHIFRLSKKLNDRSLSLIEDAIKEAFGHLKIGNIAPDPQNFHSFIEEPYYFEIHSTAEEIVTEIEKHIPDYYHEQLRQAQHAAKGLWRREGDHYLLHLGIAGTASAFGWFGRHIPSYLFGIIQANLIKAKEEAIALSTKALQEQQMHNITLQKNFVNTLNTVDSDWAKAHTTQQAIKIPGCIYYYLCKPFGSSYIEKEDLKTKLQTEMKDMIKANRQIAEKMAANIQELTKQPASIVQNLPALFKKMGASIIKQINQHPYLAITAAGVVVTTPLVIWCSKKLYNRFKYKNDINDEATEPTIPKSKEI